MNQNNNASPYKSDGETVYATEPDSNETTRSDDDETTESQYKNRDWLYRQYHSLKKSAYQIADECGVHNSTINRWIEKHDIEKRDHGELVSNSLRRDGPWRDFDWLYTQYVTKGKSTVDIADEYDTSHSTISRWLEKHEIEKRGRWSEEFYDKDYHSEDWLKHQYKVRELSLTEIAKKCGVSDSTICRWLDRHNIETRDAIEAMSDTWAKKKKTPKQSQTPNNKSDDEDAVLQLSAGEYHGPSTGLDISGDVIGERSVREFDNPYRDENWLREQYVKKDLPGPKIAELCDVSSNTIYTWMKKFDIQRSAGDD